MGPLPTLDEKQMQAEPSKVPHVLLDYLRQALAGLARGRGPLAEAAWDDAHRSAWAAPKTQSCCGVRSIERIDAARRSLEDALGLAEALCTSGENALVKMALRQHGSALAAREAAEARCEHERQQVTALRAEVGDLERALLRGSRSQSRMGTPDEERAQALDRQRVAGEAARGALRGELESIDVRLSASVTKNRDVGVDITRIERDFGEALAENGRAQQALGGDPSLDVYRRTKERERAAAETSLVQAQRQCEEEIRQLDIKWAGQQEAVRSAMAELQGDAQALQARLSEKRAHAEGLLVGQSAGWGRTLREAEDRLATEVRRMEGTRKDKAAALNRMVVDSRQRMKDAGVGTQRLIESHRKEMKHVYRYRLRVEEARCEDRVQAERRAAEHARLDAERWEKAAQKNREGYKVHALKSKSYVRSMDPNKRKQLMELFTKAR